MIVKRPVLPAFGGGDDYQKESARVSEPMSAKPAESQYVLTVGDGVSVARATDLFAHFRRGFERR